ncbi:hypothetical protein T492DRAFT_1116406 [Pavlovales sp. CCMP2436]|nr:hypothetical protein T492DRAFT_1116406 [Pavlovales sp. CCMP2436]
MHGDSATAIPGLVSPLALLEDHRKRPIPSPRPACSRRTPKVLESSKPPALRRTVAAASRLEARPHAPEATPPHLPPSPVAMTRAALLPAAVLLAMAPGAAGMAGARKSWDFGRFINTAATFNSPADALARAFGGSTSPKMVWSPEVTNGFEFAALDDVVMGGCSQSTVRVKTDGLQWSGETTTANNGG